MSKEREDVGVRVNSERRKAQEGRSHVQNTQVGFLLIIRAEGYISIHLTNLYYHLFSVTYYGKILIRDSKHE